jgi:cyclin-dependent kinase regulatory subunit CKS1
MQPVRYNLFDAPQAVRIEMERKIRNLHAEFSYSKPYEDDLYRYRHVIVPRPLVPFLPDYLMTEQQCIQFSIQQSPGWVHYMMHRPEKYVLLFRKPLEAHELAVKAKAAQELDVSRERALIARQEHLRKLKAVRDGAYPTAAADAGEAIPHAAVVKAASSSRLFAPSAAE